MILLVVTLWILMGVTTKEILPAVGYEIDSGNCGIRKVSPDISRIVGGSRSQPGRWPWQGMMQSNGVAICGAVLISEEYLLTAAHCVLSGRKDLTFHLGAYRADASDDTAVEVQVHVMICHQDFEWVNYSYDVCVVKLVKPTNFTDYIQPVCLPKDGSKIDVGEQVSITGWGKTKDTGSEEYLNEAQVLVINTTTCKSWYDSLGLDLTIPDSHFCAGYAAGQIDTCEGDSGGPLVHLEESENVTAYVLRGITSFGYGCALAERPGVYVRVSELTKWIKNKTKALSDPICQPTASAACGGNIASEALIRSTTSTDTFDYPPNQDCTWNVTAPVGFEIHFTFVCYFLLSPPASECEDHVKIIDSEGNLQIFCGNEIPSPYVVTGGNASLTFITNGKLNYPGFVVKIAFVKSISTTTVTTITQSTPWTDDITDENTDATITTTTPPDTLPSTPENIDITEKITDAAITTTTSPLTLSSASEIIDVTNVVTDAVVTATTSSDTSPFTPDTNDITGEVTDATITATTSHGTSLHIHNLNFIAICISMLNVIFHIFRPNTLMFPM